MLIKVLKCFKWLSYTLALTVFGIVITFFILPKPSLYAQNQDFSYAIYDVNGQLLRLTLTKDEKYRLYMPLGAVDPNFIKVTLMQEDRHFFQHYGINPIAIVKAGWKTYIQANRRVGASTITMQLARLRFGLQSRSVLGKLVQIFRALQLERYYSKNQILEAYLNLAPYGGNIEGIGAASLVYFHKQPSKLSLPELLTLSVIPQNPVKRMPRRVLSVDLDTARQKAFKRWIKQSPQDSSNRILVNLPWHIYERKALPFLAPHFVDHIQNNYLKIQ